MKLLFKNSILFPLIIIISSVFIVLPFFHQGYFPTHDGEWAVVRLSDMYREVKDGQVPPRFSGNLNFGYGYPLFEFAYPMPYFLGLPFFLLHFGLVNSIKILFVLSVVLSGLGMYFAAKEIWGRDEAGLISGLLYLYFPYRMVDLYVRGSLGESIASVTFPIILFCLKRLSSRESLSFIIFLALAFAMLILSHNIMAVLFGIIIFVYLILLYLSSKKVNFVQILVGLALGVGLSAFFWLPAILEKNLILLSKIPIADRDLYFVPLTKLLYSPFGYGTPTDPNPFTYQVGIPQIAVLIAACYLIFRTLIKRQKECRELLLFTTLAILFIFMLLSPSKLIWESVPLLNEINYPWTAFLPIGLLLALIGGRIFSLNRTYFIIGIFFCLFSIVFTLPFARPSSYVDRGDGFYLTNDATTTSSRELMPLTVKTFPSSRPTQKVEIIKGQGAAEMLVDKSQKKTFRIDLASPGTVRLNTIYFPGWQWYRDGKPVKFSYDNPLGVMQSDLPIGNYTITASFEDTSVRMIADIISVSSLVFIGFFLFLRLARPDLVSRLFSRCFR